MLGLTKIPPSQAPCSLGVQCWSRRINGPGSTPVSTQKHHFKKDWQCKAGRGRLTHYQSEDHSPTLQTYRGKEKKGKIVEDKKGESN